MDTNRNPEFGKAENTSLQWLQQVGKPKHDDTKSGQVLMV